MSGIRGIKLIMIAAFAVTGFVFACEQAAGVEPVKPVYIIPEVKSVDASWIGGGVSKWLELRDAVFGMISKKSGIKFKFVDIVAKNPQTTVVMGCTAQCAEMFTKGKADFAIMGTYEFGKALATGVPIEPLATIAVNGKPHTRFCLYVSPNGKRKFKFFRDLKGKKVGTADNKIMIYTVTLENGINQNINEYFSQVVQIPFMDGMYALLFNEIDALVSDADSMKFFSSMDKRFREITPLYCTKETYGNSLMVNRKGINPEALARVKKTLLKMHKDPDFKMVRFFFVAVNGQIQTAKADNYRSMTELYEKINKKGWLED